MADIDFARERIIGRHKLCGGKGVVEHVRKKGLLPTTFATTCDCAERFNLVSRYILSNIPYEKLRNQKIYNKCVVDEALGEEIDLRKEIVYPFVKKIKKVVKNPYGLLFLGKRGTGKTFIGQKILYYAISSGFTAHYLEFSDFLKILKRNFDENLDDLINEVSKVDILMFDEIGNESRKSEFTIGEFVSLYKRRVQRNQPTILVSNYSYNEFKSTYGKSIESVVGAYSKILDFKKVPDVRKLRGATEVDTFVKELNK